jgi:hypothetical protein
MLKKILVIFLLVILLARTANAEVSKESALLAISEAESIVSEMQKMGFGVAYANDTLNEAKLLFFQDHYMASETLAKKVADIKDKAVNVNSLIDAVETRIYDVYSKGYNISEARNLFEAGIAEFRLNNYAESENIMHQTIDKLDEIEARESMKRLEIISEFNIFPLLLDYLWLEIILVLSVLIIGYRTTSTLGKRRTRKKLVKLDRERTLAERRIADLQRKYFEKGSISRMDYEILMERHNKRIVEITKEKSMLKEKLSAIR